MTSEKIVAVVREYREMFRENGILVKEYPLDSFVHSDTDALRHCHNMLDDIIRFAEAGKMGKAFRWLGFVQGVCWRTGVYTIDNLRDHNRPG